MLSLLLDDNGLVLRQVLVGLGMVGMAGRYDNHLWRIITLMIWNVISWMWIIPTTTIATVLVFVLTMIGIWEIPMWANAFSYRKRQGCIFLTGCDSGMGQATVVYLAQTNTTTSGKNNGGSYEQIFAGCFNPIAALEYYEKHLTKEQLAYVTVVPLDVSKDESVQKAATIVQEWILQQNQKSPNDPSYGLTGVVMYHGIAYNGPAQYMPIQMYEHTLQVNYLGYCRMVQAFLPLIRKRLDPQNKQHQGRIVMTGTGGGPCSPCPSLLSAYMSSKFATEAYCQCLRNELYMMNLNIEVSVINPGFVKPTLLMSEGMKLSDKMWNECETKLQSTVAKDEYGPMLDHFIRYSTLQPGTHVSEICKAAEHALLAPVPRSSYKVGIDSKLAPIVGMLPTGVRETIARHGIYGILSPAGTIPGYKV